jgi:uncharacterized membrane protein required for colicin V production
LSSCDKLETGINWETLILNWLDLIIVIAIVIGAFYGFRFGLIKAAFIVLGVLIGTLFAGQLSDKIAELLTDSHTTDSVVTVLSYVVVIVGGVIAGNLTSKFAKPVLTIITLGLSTLLDRAGGLILGVLIAGLLCSAMITGLARLTYSFEADLILKVLETVPEPVGDQVGLSDKLDQVTEVKQELENTLARSAVVPIFITVTNTIPWNTLGYIPSDFKIALEILGENIE